MNMEIEHLINEHGLGRIKEDIIGSLRNTIRISLEEVEEDDIQIGKTRVGGKPDVPKNFLWPKYGNRSLSFIAQINLKEVSKLDVEKILPTLGILYFFYDSEQETWGFDPNDRESWRVIYYDGDLENLHRHEFPSDVPESARYSACEVSINSEISLPPWESICTDNMNLNEEESDAYFDMIEKLVGEEEHINKLIGYPDQVQGEMQLECQLVSNGLYCGDSSGYEDPRSAELEKGAKEWQLLLQIDSDENAQMMWGDFGRLFFWIKKEDLKNKKFDKVWMVLQCG